LTAHQSLSVRYYPFSTDTAADFLATTDDKPPFLTFTRQLTRAQTHPSPILSLSVSPAVPGSDATLFATGSADGTVKVWDTKGGFVTHVFRGHGGGISALAWRFLYTLPSTSEGTSYANAPADDGRHMHLLTGSVDTRVRMYNLLDRSAAGKPVHVLEGHVSVVRGLDVSADGRWLISAGRDRVVLVWDLEAQEKKGKRVPKVVQTLLTSESLEAVGFVSGTHGVKGVEEGRMVCHTGGERGRVRLWDVLKGSEVAAVPGLEVEEEPEEDEQRGLAFVL
jgi:U3 small nucleolar RNA-associated protein 13